MERHEFKIPFTPCTMAILVDTSDDDVDVGVTVLLKYKGKWCIAGGVDIYLPEGKEVLRKATGI